MREILDLMWRPGSGARLQSRIPECPVLKIADKNPEKKNIFFLFLSQVCLDQFSVDIEAHLCELGHVLCGTCRLLYLSVAELSHL